ncbi:unnamed protein product [Rotaria magnacalcarata]|uniref:Uncharacterized protein n=1 Tax=Rotaria magnacalcarata TaxID=392030 RepID=A0A816N214_9BILA|nr:unnamed protein product [Rotaria magnacalcarata]CAF2227092.1 unnamed protein product [Rotaria magnacalcarata]CAF4225352.1 unnamed protein product [Rotaria magnacalcarata]CAF4292905.1 unnamed protein product [Rotaria magnacalcarata]
MSQSNLTTIETTNSELHFYEQLEKHFNLLDQKIRDNSVIKQNIYNDIVKCVLLAKGKPSGFSPKFIYWVKRHFILTNIAGVDLVYCIKSKKTFLLK